jgi:hypothetical protein
MHGYVNGEEFSGVCLPCMEDATEHLTGKTDVQPVHSGDHE